MIQHGKAEAAVAIFGLNCEQFPESSNAFDSLGDAFVEIGNLEKARGSYEHALGLDPENDGSREKLAKIQD
jgi:tetratricopeptide (TPR) repeat protein